MKEIVAVTRTDDVDPRLGDSEDSDEFTGVTAVKHRKGVVAGTAVADLVGEVGDKFHLSQPGGVALGHHWCVGCEGLTSDDMIQMWWEWMTSGSKPSIAALRWRRHSDR